MGFFFLLKLNNCFTDPQQSPVSALAERFQSPVNSSSAARRTLFPNANSSSTTQSSVPAINVTVTVTSSTNSENTVSKVSNKSLDNFLIFL